jgi:hypothetical protein
MLEADVQQVPPTCRRMSGPERATRGFEIHKFHDPGASAHLISDHIPVQRDPK